MPYLRPALHRDAEFVARVWTDPANSLYFPAPEPEEIEAAIREQTLFLWEDQGQQAGFARILHWLPGNIAISEFAVAAEEKGKGHGKAFLAALLNNLFSAPDTHRVGLDATFDNAPALHLFRGMGFTQEGTFRECWLRPDGVWADCPYFSMLRREWEKSPYFGGIE